MTQDSLANFSHTQSHKVRQTASKPQKYVLAAYGRNNATEIKRGNVGAINPFARDAADEGYVFIGIDAPSGKTTHAAGIVHLACALRFLSQEWSGFSESASATAGISGGAKSIYDLSMVLAAEKLKL